MARNAAIVFVALAALAGLVFAAFSTNDFVQHLDRQVHELHCSFLPGLTGTTDDAESGCHVALMSPYSSVARESIWGGIPISLPAMAVFAFLFAFAIFIVIGSHQDDSGATGFQALAWCLPVLASIVMGYISLSTLGTACKLCIGIYASSAVGLVASIGAWIRARGMPMPPGHRGWSASSLGLAFAAGVLFVLVPVGAYAAFVPDFSSYVGSCGTLAHPGDPHSVLVPLGPQTRPVPVLEVLDPLCPSCKAFEQRFGASSVPAQASRKVLLFPLDNRCNWMIDRAIHPGACAISEAVLCAEGDAGEVIEWAFANQDAIVAAARTDPEAAARMARQQFPALANCIGSARVRARLNQSLRWAVANQLPVLTPQVYVGDLRLCDADTDLGMDYALTRLVDRYQRQPHPTVAEEVPQEASAPRPASHAPPPSAPAAPIIEVPPAPPPEEPAAEPAPAEPAPAEPAPTEAVP